MSVLLIPKQGSQKNPKAPVYQGAGNFLSWQTGVRLANTYSFSQSLKSVVISKNKNLSCKKVHMIQHPPGTPPLSISCSNFSLSALDVMLSSLYLSLGFRGIKFATQKLNFSASEDDGLSPALATSSANLEWLFPTAMALKQNK